MTEPVVWVSSGRPGNYPTGYVAADVVFPRYLSAVCEGHCPTCRERGCDHGDRLERGFSGKAPLGAERIEWAMCGCRYFWVITYEAVEEIEARYLHDTELAVPF